MTDTVPIYPKFPTRTSTKHRAPYSTMFAVPDPLDFATTPSRKIQLKVVSTAHQSRTTFHRTPVL